MAKFVRVTAKYVTLKVRDTSGAWVVRGVYEGGVFPVEDVEPESLAHHVESELAEVFSAPAEKAPESAAEPKAEEPKKAAPAKKSAA
jgi:hypothetical protein